MKKQLLFVLLLGSAAGCRQATPESGPLHSVKIRYEFTVAPMTSNRRSETLMWVDFDKGRMRQEQTRTVRRGNSELQEKQEQLFDGKFFYVQDSHSPTEYRSMELTPGAKPWEELIDTKEARSAGHDTLLGNDCEIFESKIGDIAIKSWLWHGIALKKVITSKSSTQSIEATAVEKNVTLDDATFTLPPGATIVTQQQAYQRLMEKTKKLHAPEKSN